MADEVKEKLNRLRARRRGHRDVCTKLEKEATELLQIPEGEGDHIERSEVIALQLQEKLKLLSEIDEEILDICDVNDIRNEIEESAEISDRISNTKRRIDKHTKSAKSAKVQDHINNMNVIVTNSNLTPSTSMEQESIENTTESTNDNLPDTIEENEENTSLNLGNSSPLLQQSTTTTMSTTPLGHFVPSLPKLPKLELPKYGGKVTEWNSFWDLYDSAIHSN